MRRILIGVSLLALVSCGSNPVAPAPVYPAIVGSWTGNMESSNYAAVSVAVTFTQANDTVNGNWTSPADWNGTVQGTVTTAGSFSGTMTISAPNALGVGPRCTGNATLSGTANAATFNANGAGFTGSCTGMPQNVRVVVQKR